MNPGWGWPWLLLLVTSPGTGGQDELATPSDREPILACELRAVEFDGVRWRQTVGTRLRPLAHPDGLSVWLADSAARGEFLAVAHAERGDAPADAPKLSAAEGVAIRFAMRNPIHYVAHVERVADGPVGEARRVGFIPRTAQVADGFQVQLSGRAVEGGTCLKVQIEDVRLVSLTPVSVEEVLGDQDGQAGEGTALAAIYQVPVIHRARLEGEWTVPPNQSLVLGLGPHSIPGVEGRSEIRERVILLTPRWIEGKTPQALSRDPQGKSRDPGEPVLTAARLTPPLPSLSLPEAIDPQGRTVSPEALFDPLVQPSSYVPAVAPLPAPSPTRSNESAPLPPLEPVPASTWERQAPVGDPHEETVGELRHSARTRLMTLERWYRTGRIQGMRYLDAFAAAIRSQVFPIREAAASASVSR
jgi:hypothetical protein